jgi:hypothetical protein
MTQIPVTFLNVSDMLQHILKSPAHLLSILYVHSKNTQLMSFTGYMLTLSLALQWSLGVLTDAHFLRDKAAALSAAITRRACRTVCDDTARHIFRKFNGLPLIL